jgi:hypothetical protein
VRCESSATAPGPRSAAAVSAPLIQPAAPVPARVAAPQPLLVAVPLAVGVAVGVAEGVGVPVEEAEAPSEGVGVAEGVGDADPQSTRRSTCPPAPSATTSTPLGSSATPEGRNRVADAVGPSPLPFTPGTPTRVDAEPTRAPPTRPPTAPTTRNAKLAWSAT